jgi:hypothetical protein
MVWDCVLGVDVGRYWNSGSQRRFLDEFDWVMISGKESKESTSSDLSISVESSLRQQ